MRATFSLSILDRALLVYKVYIIMRPSAFAMKLKALRTARGMTQATLAKKMKMHQVYIAQLETGVEANPTLDTLRRLAKALKVSVAGLVE